jgi:hypothetical protein
MIASSNQASFRIPFMFIATGIIAFLLFHAMSLSSFAQWTSEYPRGPEGWTNTHLLVLGWGTMIAMGAVYQLMNVVLQKDLYSRPIGYVHYGCFALGTAGLLIGFFRGNILWIGAFATLAFVGILLFAWNIGRALIQANQWNTITVGAGLSLLYLVFTGLTGMAMGLDFPFNYLGHWHDRLLGAHLWFGAVGWFGQLIIAFSYKMLPMFYLSHGHSTVWEKPILYLWNGAVILGAAAFLSGTGLALTWLAFLLLACAFVCYNLQISNIMKKKHKTGPGEGVVFTVWAVRGLTAFLFLVLIYAAIFPHEVLRIENAVILGWVYLWGWVAFTILGYMSKIVPFLWWTHKYGALVGKQPTPSLSKMIDERWVRALLHLTGTGMVVLVAGLALGSSLAVAIGGTAMSIFAIGYMAIVALVFSK